MATKSEYFQQYLTAATKHGLTIAQAFTLARLARSTHRYNESLSRGTTANEDARDNNRTLKARAIAQSAGLHLIEKPDGWPYVIAHLGHTFEEYETGSFDLFRVPPFTR